MADQGLCGMTKANLLLLTFAVLFIVTILVLLNQPGDLSLDPWERLI